MESGVVGACFAILNGIISNRYILIEAEREIVCAVCFSNLNNFAIYLLKWKERNCSSMIIFSPFSLSPLSPGADFIIIIFLFTKYEFFVDDLFCFCFLQLKSFSVRFCFVLFSFNFMYKTLLSLLFVFMFCLRFLFLFGLDVQNERKCFEVYGRDTFSGWLDRFVDWF